TIAWLNRCRRLAKDWECLNRKAFSLTESEKCLIQKVAGGVL
ncbi:MAG: IS5/IS1182 family transposase, partial [Pseudolabrys sp.]